MNLKRLCVLVASGVVTSITIRRKSHICSAASSPTTTTNGRQLQDAILNATEFVENECIQQGIPGCSVAVIKGHELLWSFAYGYIDLENRVKATPKSLFRIASISKCLTSAGIGVLMQQGLISLQDNIAAYIADYPSPKLKETSELTESDTTGAHTHISVRQLMSHTSGIRSYKDSEFEQNSAYRSSNDALAIFKDDPLMFAPGTKFHYSTYNYTVVAAIIEQIKRTKFTYFMRDEVLDKLHMFDTLRDSHAHIVPRRSRQYVREQRPHRDDLFRNEHQQFDKKYSCCAYRTNKHARLYNAVAVDNSNKYAGGGYLSTANDIAQFADKIVLSDEFLTAETKRELFKVQKKNYACGWHVFYDETETESGESETKSDSESDRLKREILEISHSGGAVGGCSHVLVIPGQQLVVVILVNLQQANPYISRQIAKYFQNL